ncbi:MAG: hypothetical protein M1839_000699 [Geoglossum umbratile]|nr:MAG: hypothetical protein M1839_000699 [Geoglossum umbratile]
MSAVASKNPYDLLGNDPEEDSDRDPEPPTKAVEKTLPRTAGRKVPEAAPSAPRARGGRRGGGFTGNEEAFRDRTAGSTNNRAKSTDDGQRQERHPDRVGGGRGAYEGRGRGRGGRGSRGVRDDRHSRTAVVDSEKQINQGWGAPKGDAEWNDEQAGEAIAKAEEKIDSGEGEGEGTAADAVKEEPAAAAEPEPEPEDNTKSYSEYLAELAEKKMQLGGAPPARKPNEGSKQDKKWAKAKELKKDEEEDTYIAGAGGKAKRERQRKEKAILEIDQRYVEPSRGNREGGRGGRGRGEGRGDFRGGDRGRGGGRGRGEGRGDFRGGRGGPRGGGSTQVNVADTDAFPSLGK